MATQPDESTYWKRVQRFQGMMDVDMVFVTDSDIDEALKIIENSDDDEIDDSKMTKEYANKIISAGKIVNLMLYIFILPFSVWVWLLDRELSFSYVLIIDHHNRSTSTNNQPQTSQTNLPKPPSAIHPDTKEKIFAPLRVSYILPMNGIITVAMLSASASGSLLAIGLSQWLNQTYNVTHYYANRNASNVDNQATLVQAYLAATTASVGVGYGIEKLARSSVRFGPGLRLGGPFAAVAMANCFNMGLMRQSEYTEGINVKDEDGDIIGKSKIAGGIGLATCVAGRVMAAAPSLVFPGAFQNFATKTFLKSSPILHMPFFIVTILATIQITVPLGLGAFKQYTSLPVNEIEKDFTGLKTKTGKEVNTVYFNRGI